MAGVGLRSMRIGSGEITTDGVPETKVSAAAYAHGTHKCFGHIYISDRTCAIHTHALLSVVLGDSFTAFRIGWKPNEFHRVSSGLPGASNMKTLPPMFRNIK
jgi:hypothetical protein